MSTAELYGLCGAALVSIGAYGLIVRVHLLRRILGFNLVGSGVFLLFGSLASRGAGGTPDPVPQAMVITGIVVALAATALAVSLAGRLHDLSGEVGPPGAGPSGGSGDGGLAR